ncbi:CATRA system-associated protein [Streptomyces sp. NPDC057939]|uniref:CATRA system-associated protein n=1 Tax=Streptomyces sp. NPDC057939 TaxID=3346284 RepID=UPI0036E6692B
MENLRLTLFGRARVRLGEDRIAPPPLTTAVLARLALGRGESVSVDEIAHDVWGVDLPVRRGDRVAVQKHVLALRRLFSPGRGGRGDEVIVTEPGRPSAYRLALRTEQIDLWEFQALIAEGRRLPAASAVTVLSRALALWRVRPLQDVEGYDFARRPVGQLWALRESAQRDLFRAYMKVGDSSAALSVGEELAEHAAEDAELDRALSALRDRVREVGGAGEAVLRGEFPLLGTAVVLVSGDLFDQTDADLVIGFSDTFDTATDDRVINRGSLQGQLLHALFDDDRTRLDAELRRALRHVPRASVESRSRKRLGKLIRYPIGTVVPMWAGDRQVFGVAYSRMGNDLVAASSFEHLTSSLDRLWDHVARHGRRRPLAMGLVGSGLARMDGTTPPELLTMVVRSFLARARKGLICPELRLVVRPGDIGRIGPAAIADFLRAQSDGARIEDLRPDGREGPRTMSSHDEPTTAQGGSTDYADAIEVLAGCLKWQLPEADWVGVRRAVEALASALRDGSHEDLRDATSALEDAAPSRMIKSGPAPEEEGADPGLQDRVAVLLHDLVHRAAQQQADGPADPGRGGSAGD